MGTKNDPGEYDCYTNAEPDEPIFILRSTDLTSQYFVAAWVAVRCGDLETAKIMMDYTRCDLDEAGLGRGGRDEGGWCGLKYNVTLETISMAVRGVTWKRLQPEVEN